MQQELHDACKRGDLEAVRMLLAKGAHPREVYKTAPETWVDKRYTVLHLALESRPSDVKPHPEEEDNRFVDLIEALLNAGADPNAYWADYNYTGW